MSRRVSTVLAIALFLSTAQGLMAQGQPGPDPRRSPVGPDASDRQRADAEAEQARIGDIVKQHRTPYDDPTMGPLDPGPYPSMPGYFTRRSIDLNYNRTPFFNRYGYGGYGGYNGGNDGYDGQSGGPGYFPGVYPYYDANYHYQWYLAYRRERKLRTRSDVLRAEGLAHFRDSEYDQAAIRLLGASELDMGDAVSRIHAGHALFALKRYEDSAQLLRRAFELAPSLVYGDFDPREDWGNRRDFDAQLDRLKQYVKTTPQNVAAHIVLGYMLFFVEGPTPARPVLQRAAAASPNDSLIERLLGVSSKTALDDAVKRAIGQRDTRTYDEMGVRPARRQTYDEQRKPSTPVDEKPDDPAKKKGAARRV